MLHQYHDSPIAHPIPMFQSDVLQVHNLAAVVLHFGWFEGGWFWGFEWLCRREVKSSRRKVGGRAISILVLLATSLWCGS